MTLFVSILIQIQPSLTAVTSVTDGLKKLYNEKLKPLELTYRFNEFSSPALVSGSKAYYVLIVVSSHDFIDVKLVFLNAYFYLLSDGE